MKIYTAIVERCQDTGLYVGFIPGFQGAHTQAETLDELNRNLQEVVTMLLEDGDPELEDIFRSKVPLHFPQWVLDENREKLRAETKSAP
jgi:predicted RNase H-like HicB family nuclease